MSPQPLDLAESSGSGSHSTADPAESTPLTALSSSDAGESFSPPPRTNTVFSNASSVVEPPWTKQFVLSFDGGGIRGYSSLLIVKSLIDHIARIEKEPPDAAPSSFAPKEPILREQHVEPQREREELGKSGFKKWFETWKDKSEVKKSRNDVDRRALRGQQITDDERELEQTVSAEEAKRRKIRNDYLPCHYFDYIGGTSTGGLISIMLSRLRMSVDDAIEEYETLAGFIFGHPRIFSIRGPIPFPRDKYNSKRVVEVIQHVVLSRLCGRDPAIGQDLFSSHERMCKTVVVSYMSRRVENEGVYVREPPYLFRSYDHHPHVSKKAHEARNVLELNPGYAHRIPIWQVARATSAAPTYFNAITIDDHKFLDGGFGTNNPAAEIYREVCQMNGNNKSSVALLVSIGTGQSKISRFANAKGSLRKYLTFLQAAKKMATDGEEVHQRMQNDILPTSDNESQRYHRFNVPYTRERQPRIEAAGPRTPTKTKPLGDMALDEWKVESKIFQRDCNTTVRDIKVATELYLSDPEVQEDLQQVARVLVTARRERCETQDWELVSTGTQYRCVYTQCHSLQSQKMRARETSLRNHLKHIHKLTGGEIDKYVELGRCPS